MIPKETVDLILDTARVEEVVGDYVTLKRRGASLWACCPFHNEKTPSFAVTPAKGIYKCFGCGKSGSAVGFLMDYEHLTYPEALRALAKKYNIEIKEEEETADQIAARQRSESLLAASEFAFNFFKQQLLEPEGKAIGYKYFRERGLLPETIEKYGLGWAPTSRSALTTAAKEAGYKDEFLLETGLCTQWESDGSLHDRFYDRVIFPVHSVSGRVIAFGGRTLLKEKTDKIAKYVNSKESEIYVKSRSLYGIWFAKSEIARQDRCYLMEGYLDVLSMHQAGILNCVASSGTSLTEEQIRIIKKFTDNVTIMYDGDSAGLHAAIRAIGMILKEGMNPRVVFLPDGDDPDSYSRKHTLEEIREFISAHEQDGIAFKTDLLLSEASDDPLKKAGLINEIADTVADIPDPITRQVYVDTVARRFQIEADIIQERVRKTREKLARDQRIAADRDQARRERENPAGSYEAPSAQGNSMPEVQYRPSAAPSTVDSILAPSERELLGFILRYGRTPLQFETDSEFYDPEGSQSVAEFIDSALAGDDIHFSNPAYEAAYQAYFQLYDQGMDQDSIVLSLLNGEDRAVASVAAELSTEKYEITVHNFTDALTTVDSWLVKFVPRSILAYHDKRITARQQELSRSLAQASAQDGLELMKQLSKLNELKKTINIKLGRLPK
ncbi:MAG: DNA primase [Bacteroidales bacterium]|nr:DNA primase [Bacteroidales bacterium]